MFRMFLILIVSFSGVALAQGNHDAHSCRYATEFANVASANPLMVLVPGWYLVLRGDHKGGEKRVEYLVTDEVKNIDGVQTRVVREQEWYEGQLREESFLFLVICSVDKSVLCYGEEEHEFHDGRQDTNESWIAGQNGAARTIFMPGQPVVGERFAREMIPGVDEEYYQLEGYQSLSIGGKIYEGAAVFIETSMTEDEAPSRCFYLPGIGLAIDDDGLQLSEWGFKNK